MIAFSALKFPRAPFGGKIIFSNSSDGVHTAEVECDAGFDLIEHTSWVFGADGIQWKWLSNDSVDASKVCQLKG